MALPTPQLLVVTDLLELYLKNENNTNTYSPQRAVRVGQGEEDTQNIKSRIGHAIRGHVFKVMGL